MNAFDDDSGAKCPDDDKLASWLNEQAATLKKLVSRGVKLKTDFIQNARQQGEVLVEVRKRLEGTDLSFADWIKDETDIGVSTAYLWCDVAEWWDDLHPLWQDSNPLEFSLRRVRDSIRDARQAAGGGKPGSGKLKTTTTSTPWSSHEELDAAVDTEDIADTADERRWEREAAKAEVEAGGGDKSEPKPALYSVSVLAFSDSDQDYIYQALSHWSPIKATSLGTKQHRSVTAHVRPSDIGTLMAKLGQALEGNQPKRVRVSIEA